MSLLCTAAGPTRLTIYIGLGCGFRLYSNYLKRYDTCHKSEIPEKYRIKRIEYQSVDQKSIGIKSKYSIP